MPELAPETREFELHCHSTFSRGKKITLEGTGSPKQIVQRAKKLGLGGIALTDHDSVVGWKEARAEARRQGIVFIPGVEVSSRDGHVIGLGVTEDVRPGLGLEETLDRVRAQGGLAVAPHPFDVRRKGIRDGMGKADAIEVFDALSIDRVSNWVCIKKAKGLGKPWVGGSDAHSLDMLGRALNLIKADSMDGVLKAIRQGKVRFKVDYHPLSVILDWTRERFIHSQEDVLEYIANNYPVPKAWMSRKLMNRFVRSDSRVWYGLGVVGLCVSIVYSGLKALTY
ncbi:MAG: CehA/McbA family metallohydrolase [Candidatus Aenigmatarchaeota archaeon]